MTATEFRRIALGISGAVESSHGDHPDFRVEGKVFATLGYPDAEHGMVKLSPDQQRNLVESSPKTFAACTGAWGKRGATSVFLKSAKIASVRKALQIASQNILSKRPDGSP